MVTNPSRPKTNIPFELLKKPRLHTVGCAFGLLLINDAHLGRVSENRGYYRILIGNIDGFRDTIFSNM